MRRRRRRISRVIAVVALLTISTATAAGGRPSPGKTAPVLLTPPSIAGAAVEGVSLVANPGTWSGPTKSYAFRWARCDSSGAACAAISAARDVRYIVAPADVGNTLRVSVIATNKNGSAVASSSATPVVVSAPAAPTTSSPAPAPEPAPAPAPAPPPPPPPSPAPSTSGDQHGFPRTYQINTLIPGLPGQWKYDWVVGFAWQDVQGYHALNPTGVAMTYVRLDNPAYNLSQLHPYETSPSSNWTCSNIGMAFQAVKNFDFAGEQEKYTLENWPGGTDNVVDGQAANVGFMRPWNVSTDTLGTEACAPNEETHTWNLANAGGLVGQLMTYAAKIDRVYGNGWNGVWSDNAYSRGSTAWTDGLVTVGTSLRNNLPAKSVGGNGAWISWYRNGFGGSDPEGFLKAFNANLVEGFGKLWGTVNQTNVDSFIFWNRKWQEWPDNRGMPRYNAYWDFAGGSSYARMRWGLTLSMMASMYFAPSSMSTWYDEFWGGVINQRGYLGQPSGPAVKLASGVYRRDFQNGIALNNSTGSTQTVNLGGTFRHLTGTQVPTLNDGSSVSSVTVPDQDGLILLR
jgi:hypothetical protein